MELYKLRRNALPNVFGSANVPLAAGDTLEIGKLPDKHNENIKLPMAGPTDPDSPDAIDAVAETEGVLLALDEADVAAGMDAEAAGMDVGSDRFGGAASPECFRSQGSPAVDDDEPKAVERINDADEAPDSADAIAADAAVQEFLVALKGAWACGSVGTLAPEAAMDPDGLDPNASSSRFGWEDSLAAHDDI